MTVHGAACLCGCCEGELPPETLELAAGQPSLAYRIGTHSSFLRRLLREFSRMTPADGPNAGTRPLARLTTRDPDDLSIALLDGGATVLDVLAFYEERIANEGYLRTSTERRSLLELAREIGYELRPGVAAGAFLAFTVEDAPGAPGIATIAAGTPVQSVPAHDKMPQTFETSDDLEAKAAWNALHPRRRQPQQLVVDDGDLQLESPDGRKSVATQLYLDGTTTNLKPGDLLLAALPGAGGGLATATVVVRTLDVDLERQQTVVELAEKSSVPSWKFVLPIGEATFEPITLGAGGGSGIGALSASAFSAYLGMSGLSLAEVHAAAEPKPLPLADAQGVFALRARLGFFGHNAPAHDSMPVVNAKPVFPNNWDDKGGTLIWQTSAESDYPDASVFLERLVPEIVPKSWAVFKSGAASYVYWIDGVVERSLADFALAGRSTGLALKTADGGDVTVGRPSLKVRETTAYVQSEQLALVELPIVDDLVAGQTTLELEELVDLTPGHPVVLAGKRSDNDLPASEVLVVAEVVSDLVRSSLRFETGLVYGYTRSTVTVNANVVGATHGETVREVLGGGDASQAHQRFTLRKPPLTYVSAATASGAQSTLEVRVSGVRWDERRSLLEAGPTDPVYVTQNDEVARTTLTFGDGERGARLPTGAQNVVAVYRSGIGPDGDVDADTLTIMQARPLGVRGVTNPLRAEKGAAPEALDDARRHAPLAACTLDRIVSLQDFEDFASAFAGVGKAQAVELWSGETRLVHATVAADGGGEIAETSLVYSHLVGAMDAARDPTQPLRVASYEPLFFDVWAGLLIDARYLRAAVEAAATAALAHAFSFAARDFGQPVTAAEVLMVLQSVAGVVAADLDKLYLVTDSSGPAQFAPPAALPAQIARWNGAATAAAELLLLNPAGVALTEMKP